MREHHNSETYLSKQPDFLKWFLMDNILFFCREAVKRLGEKVRDEVSRQSHSSLPLSYVHVTRRKIRLIEGNAKCGPEKNFPVMEGSSLNRSEG
jgi:hypothetical protein